MASISTIPVDRKISYFDSRHQVIEAQIDASSAKIEIHADDQVIEEQIKALSQVKINSLAVLIFRIVNFVVRLFNSDFNKINTLLRSDLQAKNLICELKNLLDPINRQYTPISKSVAKEDQPTNTPVLTTFNSIQKLKLDKFIQDLMAFKKNIEYTDCELEKAYQELPEFLKKCLKKLVYFENQTSDQLQPSLDDIKTVDISHIEQLLRVIEKLTLEYQELVLSGSREITLEIKENEQVLTLLSEGEEEENSAIYDVSTRRLFKEFSKEILNEPVTVTMVGVEYSGLMKQGGLAEVLEGLSMGIKKQHEDNRVRLIFPKFSHLPKDVRESLKEPETHTDSTGAEYEVYKYEKEGVECFFIEHPSFELDPDKPDIYGPDWESQAKRFAAFSTLAADLIYDQKDTTDLIHLHDWHVAGVAMKLKKDHREEWDGEGIPPVLFTYHNNNRSAQGRLYPGPYNYAPVTQGYRDCGLLAPGENLFVQAIKTADAVTTVSEQFGIESQEIKHGEDVSFVVKEAAKAGKLFGIINGTNTTRWNPETDPSLKNWKDIASGAPIDLSYGPESADIVEQKQKCKEQLAQWITKYKPEYQDFDPSKPIITYIGRYDSYQKGMDHFVEAIEETLKNGGQFVCVGSFEDKGATKILDEIEAKFKKGVLVIRDEKVEGKYKYQQGNGEMPGVGSVIRGATDFIFMPSKYEPCGLVQIEGWLFGSLAIGANTGGLKDTINDSNGFLFEREGAPEDSLKQVLKKALKYWSEQSEVCKAKIMRKMIRDGRRYNWNDAPEGIEPPVRKYRYAYAKALKRRKWRKEDPVDEVTEVLKRRLPIVETGTFSKAERYMKHFYEGKYDSKALYTEFRALPKNERSSVPSPFGAGVNYKKYNEYGPLTNDKGTSFTVYAPMAREVKIVLVDEIQSEQEHPMVKNDKGEWSLDLPGVGIGQKYKYKINGEYKIDPYGREFVLSKNTREAPCSVVTNSDFAWDDEEWMRKRQYQTGTSKPVSIYELHPTTWKKADGKPLNYRELGKQLVEHCNRLGYTHVELMGILEHPDEVSWGYQVAGYFAPNSRLGSVEDFKWMVAHLHKNKIGVYLDWVPAHFTMKQFALSNFDGSSLYEASGLSYFFSIRNLFFKFGSKHFDYTKKEVREFLISSAAYWLGEMHIDGLRVDCVRSMLNSEDKESARLFMRDLNAVVHQKYPGTVTIAEEYSGDRCVTASSHDEGLDFDLKWHVGWMHHTLNYFSTPLSRRKKQYGLLSKAIECDNHHKQVMFFSHDQVKRDLKTLFNKAQGMKESKKYANVRAMLSFMMSLPGKKLHFMGGECGNERAWNSYIDTDSGVLDGIDLKEKSREGLMQMISDLNALYRENKAFWEHDDNGSDIEWIEKNDPEKRVTAYRRVDSEGSAYACFHNFTGKEVKEYTVKVKGEGELRPVEVFNSDGEKYNGKGRLNDSIRVETDDEFVTYTIQVPPLSTVIIREM